MFSVFLELIHGCKLPRCFCSQQAENKHGVCVPKYRALNILACVGGVMEVCPTCITNAQYLALATTQRQVPMVRFCHVCTEEEWECNWETEPFSPIVPVVLLLWPQSWLTLCPQELFCVCGALKRARLVHPGVAEVVFVKKEDAITAYKKYNNRCLDGKFEQGYAEDG